MAIIPFQKYLWRYQFLAISAIKLIDWGIITSYLLTGRPFQTAGWAVVLSNDSACGGPRSCGHVILVEARQGGNHVL